MDILTLELFDVTVSEALREVNRVLEDHPGLPLRIVIGGDDMLLHNVQRFLERSGRTATPFREGSGWRVETASRDAPAPALARAPEPAVRVIPAPAPAAPRPLLLTRAALGDGNGGVGRRLLLGVLRELDPQVPWVALALEATGLLEDPEALALLTALQARGTPVRVSRGSLLFPDGPGGAFEVIEDSQWQRLAGKGELTIL
ncbi:hypothetical protein [Mesoterricola silvestris]|uniref:Uncharacterized protein n=1 Tax=Mesoterricola silvestris TaxID=2927979 RepID=A0AA48GJI8_9BACT|nr:hypothetical protein [Mesoterricola silvestris]BDU72309.1 hypothetical protein METEAL_14830 [Mesoterricola silvestris]